jgi:hypothetical protein
VKHARLIRYSLGPGRSAEAQKVADELAPLIALQQGCENVAVFGDNGDGEGGIFVVWDSEANDLAAAEVIGPFIDRHLSGLLEDPPENRLFEVIWTR